MIKKTLTHKVILIYRKHVEIDLLLQTVARSVPKLWHPTIPNQSKHKTKSLFSNSNKLQIGNLWEKIGAKQKPSIFFSN